MLFPVIEDYFTGFLFVKVSFTYVKLTNAFINPVL